MAVSETNTFKEEGLQWKDGCDGHEDEEEEEALSLSDLPIVGRGNCESNDVSSSSSSRSRSSTLALEAQDFEFSSWVEEDLPMCAADEVFFQGQILPLRPSVSSECGLLSGFRPDSRRSSLCGSRSDSMERSLGNSSSLFSSRSHSLSSSSSTFNLYSHPTPKPQMGKRNIAAKTSRKSSGWGLFRLGLVRTPEIELQDLKFRKRNSMRKNESRKSSGSDDVKNLLEKQEQGLQRFFGGGLGCSCKCSADAVDTVSSRIVILKSRKGEAMSQRRTFEWLKELSIGGAPVV